MPSGIKVEKLFPSYIIILIDNKITKTASQLCTLTINPLYCQTDVSFCQFFLAKMLNQVMLIFYQLSCISIFQLGMLWIRPVGYPAIFYFRIRYLTGFDSGISCQISESLDIRLKKQQVFLKQRIVTSFDLEHGDTFVVGYFTIELKSRISAVSGVSLLSTVLWQVPVPFAMRSSLFAYLFSGRVRFPVIAPS